MNPLFTVSRKHTDRVCDRDIDGGVDDGPVGAVDEGDIKGVQITEHCKHNVVFCDVGTIPGEWKTKQLSPYSKGSQAVRCPHNVDPGF